MIRADTVLCFVVGEMDADAWANFQEFGARTVMTIYPIHPSRFLGCGWDPATYRIVLITNGICLIDWDGLYCVLFFK